MMEQLVPRFPAFRNVSVKVALGGREVKVHGLCTGSVAVKESFKKKKGSGGFAKLNILLDRHYTGYMPIWVWVIEHPDGLIVIDTGENTRVSDLDRYLEHESWFLRYQFKHAAQFRVLETDELDHQFRRINLRLDDVALVVLTHLHLDHTDGLRFFPRQEIIVGAHEYRHADSHMPSTYPDWFHPNKVTYRDNKVEVFNQAFPLTRGEDLLYIPTPGHTAGHSSVLFKTDEFDILFAGDTSYTQDQVLHGELAGVNADYDRSAQTYRNIIDYGRIRNTIYLPTHDEKSGARLESRSFLS